MRDAQLQKAVVADTSLGRMGEPENVAGVTRDRGMDRDPAAGVSWESVRAEMTNRGR